MKVSELNQSAAVGRERIRTAVQAGGRQYIMVAIKPAGDAGTQLERIRLVIEWTETGTACSCTGPNTFFEVESFGKSLTQKLVA